MKSNLCKNLTPFLRHLLIGMAIPLGIACAGAFILPYPTLKHLFDSLSKDGNMERMTPQLYNTLHIPFIILGFILLAIEISLIFQKKPSEKILDTLQNKTKQFFWALTHDARTLLGEIKAGFPTGWELIILTLITLAALFIRLLYIYRPFEHDEAYTFITFADLPFRYLISDYHFPNNHIFHTVLVRLSFLIFGIQPWAIRLPALIAGVLVVPFIHLLTRQLYSKNAGLFAAGLAASCQFLIDYSSWARGYTWVALFTLLTFLLGTYLIRKNNAAAWVFLAFLGALGLWTIPVMLNSLGILYLWLFCAWLLRDTRPVYKNGQFVILLAVSFVGIGLLTALFYTPVILNQGLGAITANNYVIPVPVEQNMPRFLAHLRESYVSYTSELPLPILFVFYSIGILTSLFLHKRITWHRFPLFIVMIGFLLSYQFIMLPNTTPRTWTGLIPLLLMLVAAGWITSVENLIHFRKKTITLAHMVCAILLILILIGNIFRALNVYQTRIGKPGVVEATTLYL
jgi:4-amino-4-deoxy-L-arabinose transferase-like glycosyltransferase